MQDAHFTKLQQFLAEAAGHNIPPAVLSSLSIIQIGLEGLEKVPLTPEIRKLMQDFGAQANFIAARPL